MTIPTILALTGTLLLIGAASNKLSSRFNMPILLMFLFIGMAVGNEGLDWINLQGELHAGPINFLGTIAMCFILFSGGMNTNYRNIRPVLFPGTVLATFGVALTALLLGVGAWLLSNLFGYSHDLRWGLLLAAVISSTDAAATFAILRGRGVSLSGKLQPLLELESGSNDPMAAFLTIFMIGIVTSTTLSWVEFPFLVYKMGMAVLLGFGVGVAGQRIFKLKLEYEGLYFVIGVAIVLLAYSGTELCGANGFLGVYVCGLTLGNQKFNYQKGILRFSDGISWLMQVTLFTVLGVLVNPSSLTAPRVFIPGLLLSAALMFVARPLAVFVSLWGSDFTRNERILVAWTGLRGAAPIVLATFPLVAHVPDAQLMFNLIFFMVITSILIQGVTLMPLARRLGLARPFVDKARVPLELEITAANRDQEMFEFEVDPAAPFVGKTLAEMNLPKGILVVLIRRDSAFLEPEGNSVIQAGDGMIIIGRESRLSETANNFFPGCDYHPAGEIPIFNKKSRLERKTI